MKKTTDGIYKMVIGNIESNSSNIDEVKNILDLYFKMKQQNPNMTEQEEYEKIWNNTLSKEDFELSIEIGELLEKEKIKNSRNITDILIEPINLDKIFSDAEKIISRKKIK